MSALNKEFPQKAELALVRENHAAVIRELQHMQDDPAYVSEWQPKTLPVSNQGEIEKASMAQNPKLTYGTPEQRTEYTVSNQHNGHELDCYVLRRVYYDQQVGSISQSLYSDGQWYTTATVPAEVKPMEFQDVDSALKIAREDAVSKGLMAASSTESFSPPPPAPDGQSVEQSTGFRPRL